MNMIGGPITHILIACHSGDKRDPYYHCGVYSNPVSHAYGDLWIFMDLSRLYEGRLYDENKDVHPYRCMMVDRKRTKTVEVPTGDPFSGSISRDGLKYVTNSQLDDLTPFGLDALRNCFHIANHASRRPFPGQEVSLIYVDQPFVPGVEYDRYVESVIAYEEAVRGLYLPQLEEKRAE